MWKTIYVWVFSRSYSFLSNMFKVLWLCVLSQWLHSNVISLYMREWRRKKKRICSVNHTFLMRQNCAPLIMFVFHFIISSMFEYIVTLSIFVVQKPQLLSISFVFKLFRYIIVSKSIYWKSISQQQFQKPSISCTLFLQTSFKERRKKNDRYAFFTVNATTNHSFDWNDASHTQDMSF